MTLAEIQVKEMETPDFDPKKVEFPDIEANDKKFQAIIDNKNQSIEQLKKYINELEIKENQTKNLKNRYEKLYIEKKNEFDHYKESSFLLSNDGSNRYIAQY